MEKEKVTIENYQELAMKTCLPSAKNCAYAHFGMLAEVRELEAKLVGAKAKEIRDDDFDKIKAKNAIVDEIGDCYWFIALMCELTDYKFSEVFWNRVIALKMSWTFYRKSLKFIPSIKKSYELWNTISKLQTLVFVLGLPLNDILQRNIDKLASRAERGKIKGNGDER